VWVFLCCLASLCVHESSELQQRSCVTSSLIAALQYTLLASKRSRIAYRHTRFELLLCIEQFLELCSTRGWYCGTTALVALVHGKKLLVGNLGDCEAVLCRYIHIHTPTILLHVNTVNIRVCTRICTCVGTSVMRTVAACEQAFTA
jgi:Protein phosphatase 2C